MTIARLRELHDAAIRNDSGMECEITENEAEFLSAMKKALPLLLAVAEAAKKLAPLMSQRAMRQISDYDYSYAELENALSALDKAVDG